ncbi:MAG: YncE family protein, partial [Gemmatimonadetes bacterium]|nr:YncE family protein [Gemmatimonadota bacterium]
MRAPLALLAALACAATGGEAVAQSYWAYVAAESEDEVALLRYDAGGDLVVEKTITTGWLAAEIEAPHGLAIDPAGEYWYLTLGHGFPNGRLVKYETGPDTIVGVADLGMFPATIAVPPHGTLALAVNANFHGDHVPSTVTIVDLETMFPIADVVTCTMPHGSRFNADGSKHYSACMMDNQLVEIDGATFDVTRRLDLIANEPAPAPMDGHMAMPSPPGANCSPTWT